MKLFNGLGKLFAVLALAALTLLPAALATGGHGSYFYPSGGYTTTVPYSSYHTFGTPRIGSYSSTWGHAQGMYNYLSAPTALTRYGAQYHVSNVRSATYPEYPTTYLPQTHRPYFGYPSYGYGSHRTTGYGGFGGYGGTGFSGYAATNCGSGCGSYGY